VLLVVFCCTWHNWERRSALLGTHHADNLLGNPIRALEQVSCEEGVVGGVQLGGQARRAGLHRHGLELRRGIM
jgi:hypothetical protein